MGVPGIGKSRLIGALSVCAATHAERGELEEASNQVEELIPLVREHGINGGIVPLIPYAEQLGVAVELRSAVEEAPGLHAPRWRQIMLLALDGEFRGASEIAVEMGSPTLEARNRLHVGRVLLERGFSAESRTELELARAFYRSVDATHWIEKTEDLLAQAQRASA